MFKLLAIITILQVFGVGCDSTGKSAMVESPQQTEESCNKIPNCSADGQVGCITTPIFAAADTSSAANKIIAGQSMGGVEGHVAFPADCTADGATGCVTVAGFRSANMAFVVAGNIKSGITLAGVEGSVTPSPADCAVDGATGCVTSGLFPAADISGFSSWNLRTGYSLGGVAGALKTNCRNQANSAYLNTGVPVSATGNATDDTLTITGHGLASNTAVRVGAPGNAPGGLTPYATTYYVIVVDADTIKLSTASGPGTAIDLTSDGGANVTVYRWGDATLQSWDTVDDYNANGAALTEVVSGWGSETVCDASVWEDVTSDGCDAAAKDCMIKDRISNLIWSEQLPTSGAAPGSSTTDYASAVKRCDDLTFGSYSDWRLPTQKELMDAYVHSIRAIGYNGTGTARASGTLDNNDYFIANTDLPYWSSTSRSTASGGWAGERAAWPVTLYDGAPVYGATGWGLTWGHNKDSASFQVICVRP